MSDSILMLALSLTALIGSLAVVLYSFWVVRQGETTNKELEMLPTKKEMSKHIVWKSFYHNPDDPRGWVPKSWGIGYTPNFRTRKQIKIFVLLLTLTSISAFVLAYYAFAKV